MFGLGLSDIQACTKFHQAFPAATVSFKYTKSFCPSLTKTLLSRVIRILFMVPVYSIACVFSIIFYRDHIYFAAIYEFYESLVIAAFFLLLCQLLHVNTATLQADLAQLQPKPWIPPIRLVAYCFGNKTGRAVNGQRWFNVCLCVI